LKAPSSRTIRWFVAFALALGLWFGRGLWLARLARGLTVNERQADCQYFCLHAAETGVSGDCSLDDAAAFYRGSPSRQILVIEPRPKRVVELGIARPFEQLVRRELHRRGVPDSAVQLIAGEARNRWGEVCQLGSWLQKEPGAEVILACPRFGGRTMRRLLDAALDPAQASRVHVVDCSDERITTTNWWETHEGVKTVVLDWLDLLFLTSERARPEQPQWSTAEYQRLVRQTIGEAPR
jgi:hypothetical protein